MSKTKTAAGTGRTAEPGIAGAAGRRLRAAGLGLVALLVAGMALASPVAAFETRPFIASFNSPDEGIGTVAADQSLDRVYLTASPSTNESGHTYAYKPDGTRDPAVPPLIGTVPPTTDGLKPTAVAVDNSGGPRQSYVYVAELGSTGTAEPRIQQYTPAGAATSVVIDIDSVPPDGTPQGEGLPNVVNPPGSKLAVYSLATDSAGNIYAVADRGVSTKAIYKFAPDGSFIAQLAAGQFDEGVYAIAVDDGGNIYLAAGLSGLVERDPQGICVDGCNPIDPAPATAVTFDASSGNIVVGQALPGFPEKGRIREYDAAHTLISGFGSEELESPTGVAILEGEDRAFVSDGKPTYEGSLEIYGSKVVLPDAVTEAATGVTDGAATFHGKVGAAGVAGATCAFEYVTQEAFEAGRFSEASTVPCDPAGPFSGEALTVVEAQVEGLVGGTLYHYRIVGTNGNGSNAGEDLPFTTKGPRVGSEKVGAVTETTAELKGVVNPLGEETSYQFEYVTQEDFEGGGFANAVKVPATPVAIGSGTVDVEVQQLVTNLTPGLSYRFRLTATSSAGVSRGTSRQFQPFPAGEGLPDGRVYEQVTPISKNGNSALGYSGLMKAAPGGGAVTYFITSGDETSEGGQEFPTTVASRGSEAWKSSSILPPSTYGERLYVTAWGEDPRISFPLLWDSGTKATFYLRDNVTGTMTAIASGLEPEFGAFAADESSDAAQVLFESTTKLLPEAIESGADGPQNLYLWDRASGAIRLVSVLPDGSTAPEGGIAGAYQWYGNEVDDGGARRGSYTQDTHVLAADASRVFFTTPGAAQIYVRKDPASPAATTVRISASKKTNGSGPGGTDPKGPQPAAFMTATPDGRFAFFTSPEELTNDAKTGAAGNDLYRFDTESDELIDVAPDQMGGNGAEVQGVLGASDDGSFVYFAANGVLASGAKPGSCESSPISQGGSSNQRCNLYVWHDGVVTFIASVNGHFARDGLNWIPTNYEGNVKPLKPSRVTPDGRTLLFFSSVSSTAYAQNGMTQVYRYRYGDGTLDCVSCNPSGQPPTSNVQLQAFEPGFTKPRPPAFLQQAHNMSTSGDQVFFETTDGLVAGDTNGVLDVYEWEADGAGSCRSKSQNGGCIYLISTGKTSTPSYFSDASASGDDVYFFTSARLVGQDTDELRDVYDARVGGGLPSQNPSPVVPCAGEACRGPAIPPTAATTPGTAVFTGPGNSKHAPKKHKKKHKKAKHKKKGHGKKSAGRHAKNGSQK